METYTLPPLPMEQFEFISSTCSCCGAEAPVKPMMRPNAVVVSDAQLMEIIERYGENAALDHYAKSQEMVVVLECDSCRELSDEKAAIIHTIRDDPEG